MTMTMSNPNPECVHQYVKTATGQLYLVGEVDVSNPAKTVLRNAMTVVEYEDDETDDDGNEPNEDDINRAYRESLHGMAKDWLSGQEDGTLRTITVKPENIEETSEAVDVSRAIRYLRACAEDGNKRRNSREFRKTLDRFL